MKKEGCFLYWKYLKYILEHKKNVFIECWKEKLYLHAFTHDLSKFSIKEFFPYARWFYGKDGVKCEEDNLYKDENKLDFENAWQHHKDKNKHHWDYWYERNLDMPEKYIKQMICDWKAMSRKFGGSARQYYRDNRHKIKLSHKTKQEVNVLLQISDDTMIANSRDIVKECNKLGLEVYDLSGYLQSGYGIWLQNKSRSKDYGFIHDFVMDLDNNCLGGTIIINTIHIRNNKKATEILTNKFKGYKLELDNKDVIW